MSYKPRTLVDEIGVRDLKPSGVTGATAASRYVGATASGAPTSGTFSVGDFVIDESGKIWICTVAGSPGTWTPVGSTLSGDTDVSIASPAAGQVLAYNGTTAKWVNQTLSAPAGALGPAVRCYNNAAISIANLTPTALPFNSTRIDQGTSVPQHSTSTNNTRLTCQQAGTYLISGSVEWAANTSGYRQLYIQVGGTTALAATRFDADANAGVTPQQNVLTVYYLNVGDFVELCVQQNSGGALNVTANGNFSPEFMMARVDIAPSAASSIPAPAVRCYNSTNISIPHAATTALTFDNNRYDQGTSAAQHSTSSNTSRLVCQQAGVYQIVGMVAFASNTTGHRELMIRVNGSTVIADTTALPQTDVAQVTDVQAVAQYYLQVGDYVELLVFQNSGGALNVSVSSNISPEFMMARIDSGPGALQPNTKVQLDYAATTDILNTTLTSGTWTDVCTNQTFTVDDTNSVIEIAVSGNVQMNPGTANSDIGTRLVVDSGSTPTTKFLGGCATALNDKSNALAGVDTVCLTGLSAGSHTVKVQVYASASGVVAFCRAATIPNTEGLQIRVLERKQSSSLPSSTPAPAVRCYNSASISIPHNTSTALTFDTNRYDQGTSTPQHSTSSNTNRLVCQQAGVYHITGTFAFNVNSTGVRSTNIRVNGTTAIAAATVMAVSDGVNGTNMVIEATYALAVGDYVELVAYQTSGGALNVVAAGNYTPEFAMSRVDTGGLTNPMTTAGDMIYGGSLGVPTRLPAGATNTLLAGGTTPAFTTAPTVSGELTAQDLKTSGLSGAQAASRYVGATASGAPISGTFAVGDFVIARNGHLFVCTAAGSPGTWADVGTAGTLSSPLSQKGDLWGYSTTDARIPVGADGQFLMADSSQALGLRWAVTTTTPAATAASLTLASSLYR